MQKLRLRNLAKTKAYRDALAVSGESDKLTRKRVIIAPGMTTACERDLALSDTGHKISRCPPLKPANQSTATTLNPDNSKLSSYRNWIEQRKTLREDLDNCGDARNWLESKPYLSEVEQRVKNAQSASEKLKTSQNHRESNADDTGHDMHGSSDSRNRPSIKQPLPVILATISDYLAKKRLRMYDLFVLADKDKDWSITKKELYEAMKVTGIPIKDDEIEQLVAALDQNHNDSLEYKELAQGRDLLVQSERAKKQSHTDLHPLSVQDSAHLQDTELNLTERPSLATRSSSQSLLSLPDTSSSEVFLMKNVDKEKRLKRQKKKEKHRHKSTKEAKKVRESCTMGGETGLMVDKFQKKKEKEYEEILELCHLYGVQLSKRMLERVLLHPEDRPKDVCISSLKPPSKYLLSQQELYRRLAPAASETHGKRRYSVEQRRKSSIYTYYVYPPATSVTPKMERMNLSSGAANISRKTDCWMTYEEYNNLTRHLDTRFEKSWKPTDNDDYWPSYVLDKVRLYLDQPRTQTRSENSIFEIIHNKTIH